MARLLVTVENSAGVAQGEGPITSATNWKQNRNLDKLGDFEFEMAANDPRRALLAQRAVVRARVGSDEVGAGVVDQIEEVAGDPTMLRVSGGDLGRELTWRTVGKLSLTEQGSARPINMHLLWISDSTGSATSGADDASGACDGSASTYYQYNTPGAQDSRPWVYIGAAKPFDVLGFTITNGVPWANSGGWWQYYNGSAWVDLGVVEDTTRNAGGETLMQSGNVAWSHRSDMALSTQNGYSGYWIRVQAGWATQRRLVETLVWPADVPTDGALALIAAKFPTGWALDTVNGLSATVKTDIYGYLDGENCVEALSKLAELTGEHWRIGDGRKVVWLGTATPASGIVAVRSSESTAVDGNADIALIKSLRRTTDSYAKVTRVYPYGSGSGDGKLTLAYCTRTAAAGYTLDKANGYIAHTAKDAAGRVDIARPFKDIGPSTSDPTAREAAANQLYDAALVWLARNLADAVSYEIEVVKAEAILPGQTVRVLYVDAHEGVVGLSVDATLIVLGATVVIDQAGVKTSGLAVSTVPQWPLSDAELLARLVGQATALGRYPQPVDVNQVHSTTMQGSGLPATVSSGGLTVYRPA